MISPEIYQTPIERLELSPRTLNCLKRAHITKVGEVLEMADEELLKIRNFGEKSLTELRDKLTERGITPQPDALPEATQTNGQAATQVLTGDTLSSLTPEDLGELIGSIEPVDSPSATAGEDVDGEDVDDEGAGDEIDTDDDEEDSD